MPSEPGRLSHTTLAARVPEVLAEWGVTAVMPPEAVAGGTLNWNFDVRAANGRFFLRCYRSNLETERIKGEHDLLRWVAQRGIPAPVPMLTNAEESIIARDHERWALFPWMPGVTPQRGSLSPAQARSLGDLHGRVQAALATHPLSTGASLNMRWDKSQSLSMLATVIDSARQKRVEPWIVDGMTRQRRILEGLDVLPPSAFASLPCQLLHGDFHDQQVLFDGDNATALVDWEIWHTDPRAWELVRSLAFSRLLDSPLLVNYLDGYREHVRLPEDEVRLALRLWFQSLVVGLWAWWAYVMEGNHRVKQFFPSMLQELDHVSDATWTENVAENVVTAACR